ncbi:MAG: DUF4194 domain-containing protein [Bacteroidota bacterium]
MEINVNKAPVYSQVLVKLLQGPVYEQDQKLWRLLLQHRKGILEYFSQIAVKLYVDEVEGYAFLKPLSEDEEQTWRDLFEEDPPRLISRRKLTYLQTVMLVLLRKLLLEHDAAGGGSRLVISKQGLIEQIKDFLPEAYDQTKQERDIKAAINHSEYWGILRKLPSDETTLEINRILKARITPNELEEMLARLKSYTENDREQQ